MIKFIVTHNRTSLYIYCYKPIENLSCLGNENKTSEWTRTILILTYVIDLCIGQIHLKKKKKLIDTQ